MALSKAIKTRYGVQANYWKITNVSVDYLKYTVKVSLSGWVSLAERLAGSLPITFREFEWKTPVFPLSGEEPLNERTIAYVLIKAKYVDEVGDSIVSEFNDATDV